MLRHDHVPTATWIASVAYLDAARNDAGRHRPDDAQAWMRSRAPWQTPTDIATRDTTCKRGLTTAALHRVFNAIHARLSEKITLQDIADTACMSRFHFARLFRRSTGYSPMEYLLQTRLERAKSLLRQGRTSISDIAVASGFADQSHLTRHFRRAVGITPLQYARRWTDTAPDMLHNIVG